MMEYRGYVIEQIFSDYPTFIFYKKYDLLNVIGNGLTSGDCVEQIDYLLDKKRKIL